MNDNIKAMREAFERYVQIVSADYEDGEPLASATSEAVICGRKITGSAGGVLDYVDKLETEIARLRAALEQISELQNYELGRAFTIADRALNAGKPEGGER